MTENELRKGLQAYLAPAGLPEGRKQAMLRQIRSETPPAHAKGETNMFRYHKFRTAMIAMAILMLLSFTVALAAGFSGYVNFKGEPVEGCTMPEATPMPAEAEYEEYMMITKRVQDILNASPQDQLVIVSHEGGVELFNNMHFPFMNVTSLDELAALLPKEVVLPRIPEGYTFRYAQVFYDCASDGAYELVRDESLEDGITIKGYRIPEGKRVPAMISYALTGSGDCYINVIITLEKEIEYRFAVNNAQMMENPDIPGMDGAILIVKPTSVQLTMQRRLNQPISVVDAVTLRDRPDAPDETLTHLVIYLYSSTVPADVLLGMFAE